VYIADRPITPGAGCFIIAELGVNHDGSVTRALELVDAAAHAGADAIKLQYFEPHRLMSRASRPATYQLAAGETDPIDMLRRLALTIDDMRPVVARARSRGLASIVTVFSTELVAPARAIAWDAFKTASPDIIHRPLLDALAHTGAPLIVSTGASRLDEVRRAVGWLDVPRQQGCLALLQCVSSYPTSPTDASIGGMAALSDICDCPIGYSDHTQDVETGALAASLGACMLEKHLTYNRAARGPDHAASLDPHGFVEYVRLVRAVCPGDAPRTSDPRVGPAIKQVLPCEHDVRRVSRQSVVAARDLPAGHVLTRHDLTCKRPGTGLEPWRIDEIIGAPLRRTVEADTPLTESDLHAIVTSR
jgi:N,N'-diacetyllegionaminate synthase